MDSSYAHESSSSPNFMLNSSGTSSEQSLNGLKFGQKLHFQDVGAAAQAKAEIAVAFSASASNSTQTKKVRVGVLQGARPPRCLVEGCEVDLTDAKPYYSRHKVCVKHSKCPTVVVAGLQQRFCQQCSRFHQLHEFDQGKRSCRRRLAGHNERRRKTPPGSLRSYNYENHRRVEGLLMDFAAYPKLTIKAASPSSRSPEQEFGNQSCSSAPPNLLSRSSQSNFRSPPSDLCVQSSMVGMSFPGHGMPPGDCFTGVTDSTCAFSLLSNQQWGSSNPSLNNNEVNNLVSFEGGAITQLTTTSAAHDAAIHQIPNTFWGLRMTESGSGSHGNITDISLAPMSPTFRIQQYDELELSCPSTRQHMEIGHSRAYHSPKQMHWSR